MDSLLSAYDSDSSTSTRSDSASDRAHALPNKTDDDDNNSAQPPSSSSPSPPSALPVPRDSTLPATTDTNPHTDCSTALINPLPLPPPLPPSTATKKTLVTGMVETVPFDEAAFSFLERRLAVTGTTIHPSTGQLITPSPSKKSSYSSIHATDSLRGLPPSTLARLKAGSSTSAAKRARGPSPSPSLSLPTENTNKKTRSNNNNTKTPYHLFIPSSQLHVPAAHIHDYQRRSWAMSPKTARTFEQLETYTPYIPKRETHATHAHPRGATSVQFSPGHGHLLLSVGLDGTANIWSVPLESSSSANKHPTPSSNASSSLSTPVVAKPLTRLRSFVAHAKGIRDGVFCASRPYGITGAGDGEVGEEAGGIGNGIGGGGKEDDAGMAGTSQLRFATAGWDGSVRVWDVESGRIETNISLLSSTSPSSTSQSSTATKSPGDIPLCVRFHPVSPHEILIGTRHRTVLQYDLRCASSGAVQTYDQHMGGVTAVAFLDGGRRFVSSADDKVLRMWEYGIPVVIRHVGDATSHAMPVIKVHPNGKALACQSMDNQIRVFTTKGGGKLKVHSSGKCFKGHMTAGHACDVAMSPDGRFIASTDSVGKLFFWDWKSTRVFRAFKAHTHGTVSAGVDWHPTRASMVASCGWDGYVKLWD